MHNQNTFGAWTSHAQTRTHKTQHDLSLGEATTFLLTVYFVFGHGAITQMSFCLGNPKIPKVRTPTTLQGHNFVCKPPIEMM
jgi:hypothetical protein